LIDACIAQNMGWSTVLVRASGAAARFSAPAAPTSAKMKPTMNPNLDTTSAVDDMRDPHFGQVRPALYKVKTRGPPRGRHFFSHDLLKDVF